MVKLSAAVVLNPIAPERVETREAWERITHFTVIALAFLLALSTARNSDLWAHLSSGRAVLSGEWNRDGGLLPISWLADVVFYTLEAISESGAALILFKCVLIAATAHLILGSKPNWRQMLGTMLALLALGGWLPLQPIAISYLALSITMVWLLESSSKVSINGWGKLIRQEWPILAMMVVWANCDPFCLIGLMLVGLNATTQTLSNRLMARPFSTIPWKLFALALIAVTISSLPYSLGQIITEFQATSIADSTSPFRRGLIAAFSQGRIEGSIPVASFWLLTIVGLMSFRSSSKSQALGRIVLFVFLFGLTLLDIRFIPFFAIGAGAIVSRNLAGSVQPGIAQANRWVMFARAAFAGLGSILLLGAAWAGWLQQAPAERRNWTIEPDPSLIQAAYEVRRLYADGALDIHSRTIFFARDAEIMFSWIAPQVTLEMKQLARGDDGNRAKRELNLDQSQAPGELLSDPKIGAVVLSDLNRLRFSEALSYFSSRPNEWRLIFLRGRVVIYVRNGLANSFPNIDLATRCFKSDHAPDGDPSAFAPVDWTGSFLLPRAPRSIDRDEAITYLIFEEATRDSRLVSGANQFLAMLAASIVGSPPQLPAAWGIDQRVAMLCTAAGAVRRPSEGPMPLPFDNFSAVLLLSNPTAEHYLAVRSARRAISVAPHDPSAYTALGESYLHLLFQDPLERSWSTIFPAIRRLRQVQAAAAFRQAILLDPSLISAHDGLAKVYLEEQFLDLAEAEIQAVGALSGGKMPILEELAKKLTDSRKLFAANSANLSDLDRARLAVRGNLAGEALDILLKSNRVIFGSAGLKLEIDLLLASGRVRELREWLTPEDRVEVGEFYYDWSQAQAAAAVGDYVFAATSLKGQINSGDIAPPSANEFRTIFLLLGKGLFNKQTIDRTAANLVTSLFGGFSLYRRQMIGIYQRKTESYLLLALLAMEQGDLPAARLYLSNIRILWEKVETDQFRYPIPARVIADQMHSLIR